MFWGSWPVNGRRNGTLQVCKRRQRKSRVRSLPIPAEVNVGVEGRGGIQQPEKNLFRCKLHSFQAANSPPLHDCLLEVQDSKSTGCGVYFWPPPKCRVSSSFMPFSRASRSSKPSLMVRNISVSELCRMMMVRQELSLHFGAHQTCDDVKVAS